MERILIVNLKRLGDVYSSAHLINSIRVQNPHAEVSLLCFEESAGAARNLANIRNVFTIDRKHLITMRVNKIFSNALALEHLFNALKQVKEVAWNKIVNVSNDHATTLICSYLSVACDGKKIGVHFDQMKNLNHSSDWDLLFNEVLTSTNFSPCGFVETNLQMLGTKLVHNPSCIRINDKHEANAESTISSLKEKRGQSVDAPIYAVALQIFASSKSKQISDNSLRELLRLLLGQENIIPVILIAPIAVEREFASILNSEFSGKLIIAESDLSALASVLRNIDLLITPDTVTKHISDLLAIPCLELNLGEAPLFKQGTVNPKSRILTPRVDLRSFDSSDQSDITASLIYSVTNGMLSGTLKACNIPNEYTLYRPVSDCIGSALLPEDGGVNTLIEAERLFSRFTIASTIGEQGDDLLLENIARCLGRETNRWTDIQKSRVTQVTKDLLATLRALLQAQESNRKASDFVTSLDRLMQNAETEGITGILIRMFRARIENLHTTSFADSTREVEGLLYELKSDLQKVLQGLKQLELISQRQRGEEIQSTRITLRNTL
jgi:ADP-heptose:LPS heptosyltransferase